MESVHKASHCQMLCMEEIGSDPVSSMEIFLSLSRQIDYHENSSIEHFFRSSNSERLLAL
jgi:hypothetical protein